MCHTKKSTDLYGKAAKAESESINDRPKLGLAIPSVEVRQRPNFFPVLIWHRPTLYCKIESTKEVLTLPGV